MNLKVGIGFSQHENTVQAAEAACHQAKRQIESDRIDLAIIFSTPQYDPQKVLPVAQNALEQTRIIGGTSAGVILRNSLSRYGIAVLAIRSDAVKLQTIHAAHLNLKDLAQAGRSFVKNTAPLFGQRERKSLLFFFDGLLENISDFSTGIQKELGEHFPVIGAGTSDSYLFSKTTQYHDREPSSYSACGVIFGGEASIHMSRRHGWKALGKPRTIKRAKKNIIEKIGNAPAIQLYEDFFQDNLGVLKNDTFGKLNSRYPLGTLSKYQQEYTIHNVMDIMEDGSLVCQDSVKTGSEVHIMIGNKNSCLQSAKQAASDIKKVVENKPIQVLFMFESASRWQILKHAWNEEIKIIRSALGVDFPIFGMLTYGELFNPGTVHCPTRNSLGNGNIILMAVV